MAGEAAISLVVVFIAILALYGYAIDHDTHSEISGIYPIEKISFQNGCWSVFFSVNNTFHREDTCDISDFSLANSSYVEHWQLYNDYNESVSSGTYKYYVTNFSVLIGT